jgi:hypothetical protein
MNVALVNQGLLVSTHSLFSTASHLLQVGIQPSRAGGTYRDANVYMHEGLGRV